MSFALLMGVVVLMFVVYYSLLVVSLLLLGDGPPCRGCGEGIPHGCYCDYCPACHGLGRCAQHPPLPPGVTVNVPFI